MAILCGIEATVLRRGVVAHEFKDKGQNALLLPPPVRKAGVKTSNFIVCKPGDAFSIFIRLNRGFVADCEYLAFLLHVGDKVVAFKYAEISYLKREKGWVLCVTHNFTWFDKFENYVDLRIFKMKKPKGSKTSRELPLDGHFRSSAWERRELSKSIRYRDGWYDAHFIDPLNFPFALFTWKNFESSTFRTLRIAPTSRTAPFEILPCTDRNEIVDIERLQLPPFRWIELIRGKRILELDRLAFRSLSHTYLKRSIDVKNLEIEKLEELATKHTGTDVSLCRADEILDYATEHVRKVIIDQVHTKTLHILAEDEFRQSRGGGQELTSDQIASELGRLCEFELSDLAICAISIGRRTIDDIKHLASLHRPTLSISQKSISTLKSLASFWLLRERYSDAQIRVIATIAGESLLEERARHPVQQARPDAAAGNVQPEVKQEQATGTARPRSARLIATERRATIGLGEASGSDNSRRRTRSQAAEDSVDGPRKRARAS